MSEETTSIRLLIQKYDLLIEEAAYLTNTIARSEKRLEATKKEITEIIESKEFASFRLNSASPQPTIEPWQK